MLSSSRFFAPLVQKYPRSPSIVICRVPELELLSQVSLDGPVLDHCCGDGWIAATAWGGRHLDTGTDISRPALKRAEQSGLYREVRWADAGVALPFADGAFRTVVNNSGIEHIPDLDRAVAEIARVLQPGGSLHFNVLNQRYFDWWPLAPDTAAAYRRFQPFHHALDEPGWSRVLTRHGFASPSFRDYFTRDVAQTLAELDYRYSAHHFGQQRSARIYAELITPRSSLRREITARYGSLTWAAPPGQGAGFLVSARRGSS